MRGSGWLLPLPAVLLWIASAGYPLVALAGAGTEAGAPVAPSRNAGELLAVSVGWSAAVALGAAVLGWGPGRLLRRLAGRRARTPLAVALLAPLCLPAYVIFFAWWQSWPPDSTIHRWAVEQGQVQLLRHGTLLVGLLCWSWPIVAWCVGAGAGGGRGSCDELLAIDGAGWWTRLGVHLRGDARGLGLGALLVFLTTINNTTCFDLAQIFTFGNELRAMRALGAAPAEVLAAAAPATAIAAIGAVAIWMLIARPGAGRLRGSVPPAAPAWMLAVALLALSTAVPLLLLARSFDGWGQVGEFLRFYGRGLGHTVLLALVCGLLAAVIAGGLWACWQDHRGWVRGAAHVVAATWLLTAILPATLIASALEAAYNLPVSSLGIKDPPLGGARSGIESSFVAHVIYREPVILLVGHLARFGFVAALLGRLSAAREPGSIGRLRRIDGATTLGGLLVTGWPALAASGVAAAMIVAVLSLSEIAVTAQLQPPGFEAIAASVLNDLHYQRPQTVLVATGLFVAAALLAAAIAVVATPWRPALLRRAALLAALAVPLGGCGSDGDGPAPLDAELVFGSPGRAMGQFSYPRAIAVDGDREVLYVIDKTARVQRFGFDGVPQLQWQMPEWENGKPTGVNVAPDGRVFVADTHYFRVIVFDPEGGELMRFGEFGTEPGQFLLPTDIAFGPQGRLYVSEYGGNDRIQVFDAGGAYLFSFGTFGRDVDGAFNRPQSLIFSADRSELFIADACNHRIVVTDAEGRTLRTIGEPGRGPGQLCYPYDLMRLADGSLLVCEFGNNRVQRFSPEGRFLGAYGRVGPDDGELQYPWGVDGTADRIFVLDSGNHRVQVIDAL